MGPGPSNTPPSVLAAMALPTLGHLDPEFLKIMDGIRSDLQALFQTGNEMTIAMSGTGSAGMETLFVNLVEPGDEVLICVNGAFGTRMIDVAGRCDATVHTLEVPWGRTFDQADIIARAREVRPKLVALVHAETSTGVHQPVDQLADAIHELDALFAIDCVTSLGGMPVTIDAWGVDAAYSGTQKCLSCPPGLSPVTLSPRAVARLEARQHKVQSWYLDLTMIRNYWGQNRVYHHTAPINQLYGLAAALREILDEGPERRFDRHRRVHEQLRGGLSGLGLEYVSQEGHHLPMLNAVSIPDGADDASVRRRLLDEFSIEIGGGLGAFKGKAWRIGLMGHTAREENVNTLLGALNTILQ